MREPEPRTVEAAASGDPRALAELIALYQDPVWRFLTRFVGDRHLAEDLTQETFLRVHRGLAGFGGRSRFSTWVFGIARHVGLDAVRRHDRRPKVVGPVGDEPADVAPLGAGMEIRDAIDSLSVPHREAILLVEVLGLTYREVADLTGTPAGTIKSRVHHARQQLHEQLAEHRPPVTGHDDRTADGL